MEVNFRFYWKGRLNPWLSGNLISKFLEVRIPSVEHTNKMSVKDTLLYA